MYILPWVTLSLRKYPLHYITLHHFVTYKMLSTICKTNWYLCCHRLGSEFLDSADKSRIVSFQISLWMSGWLRRSSVSEGEERVPVESVPARRPVHRPAQLVRMQLHSGIHRYINKCCVVLKFYFISIALSSRSFSLEALHWIARLRYKNRMAYFCPLITDLCILVWLVMHINTRANAALLTYL